MEYRVLVEKVKEIEERLGELEKHALRVVRTTDSDASPPATSPSSSSPPATPAAE